MVGVLVGGAFHSQAREMGADPEGFVEFRAVPQDRGGGRLANRYYLRTRALRRRTGRATGSIACPMIAREPSPFELLVDKSEGRPGNSVRVDASDPPALRITIGDRYHDAITCSDLHAGALDADHMLHSPRPRPEDEHGR
jgi:hypothetical protein